MLTCKIFCMLDKRGFKESNNIKSVLTFYLKKLNSKLFFAKFSADPFLNTFIVKISFYSDYYILIRRVYFK